MPADVQKTRVTFPRHENDYGNCDDHGEPLLSARPSVAERFSICIRVLRGSSGERVRRVEDSGRKIGGPSIIVRKRAPRNFRQKFFFPVFCLSFVGILAPVFFTAATFLMRLCCSFYWVLFPYPFIALPLLPTLPFITPTSFFGSYTASFLLPEFIPRCP